MKKPLIGITSSRRSRDHDRYDSNVLGEYALAITRAGGLPVLVPNEFPLDDIPQLLNNLHGILLSGGGDIYPDLYGVTDDVHSKKKSRARDRLEKALVEKAIEMDLPILGICRGHQMINAALGGTLFTDLASQYTTEVEHSQPTSQEPDYLVHEVEIFPGTHLAQIIGKPAIRVNSRHHQAIRQLAHGFVVTARAIDGLIEGIELPGKRFCMGVQWHPESLPESEEHHAIFSAFVIAARE